MVAELVRETLEEYSERSGGVVYDNATITHNP
jgi:hypothetical protein